MMTAFFLSFLLHVRVPFAGYVNYLNSPHASIAYCQRLFIKQKYNDLRAA